MLFLEKLEQKRIYVVAIAIICMLIGTVYAGVFMPKQITSSTSMLLMKTESTQYFEEKHNGNVELTNNLISTFEELIKSASNIDLAKSKLDLKSEISSKNISVKRISDSDTFQIRVSSVNADDSINANIELTKIFSYKITEMYSDTEVYIIDDAHIISSNNNSTILVFAVVSLLIGGLIDLVYILVLIQIEKNVKNSKDIESSFSLKNLALIPVKNLKKNSSLELISSELEKSSTNRAFKQLRANIQFVNVNNKNKNIILITSPSEKEGKSYVSANLAISYANSGKKVILVDADLNTGKQANLFNLPNDMGLSNFLSNLDMTGVEINERINSFIKETEIKNLNVITSGTVPPNSSELLSSSKLPEMLKDLSVFYDVIVLDGTRVLNAIDALILSRHASSVAIVSLAGKTKKDDLWKTKRDIQNVGGRIIGTILNKVKVKEDKEEKTSSKVLQALKEKLKICIEKIKENKKQKLLTESTTNTQIINEEESKIENEEQILVNAIMDEKKETEGIEKQQQEMNEENVAKVEIQEVEEIVVQDIDNEEIEKTEKIILAEIPSSITTNIQIPESLSAKNDKFAKTMKTIKRNLKKAKIKFIKFSRNLKKKMAETKEKVEIKKNEVEVKKQEAMYANEHEEHQIKENTNAVLVVVDAQNEVCRAFSKECYTEKLVRGLDKTDGFVKANYSSYLTRKRAEALMLMYSLNKRQANRIDPLIYATLMDYDECVWIEKKVPSNKAEAYVYAMAKEFPRNDGEKRKEYKIRCEKSRKEALYESEIEIDYNIELLWKTSKMKFTDKVSMNKFARIYGAKHGFNPIETIEEVTSNLVSSEQVKAKTVQELAEEVENELNIKNNEAEQEYKFNMNTNFSEMIVNEEQFNNIELQKQEQRKEAEILKKIQKEKNIKKRKEEKARKQKEREKRNREREEQRRAKEIERERKLEEARIEEELLVDNLYPKTKNNKNI